jgi:bromodomain-containing factor 1
MDLSTISKKLDNCSYETPEQFIADINLMFNNCYAYNGPDSPISRMAKNVSKAFEGYLEKMPTEQSMTSAASNPFMEDKKATPKSSKKRRSSNAYSPKSTPRSAFKPKRSSYQDHMKFCHATFREMTKQSNQAFAWPFMTPVDPIALGIPDYFEVVKTPMDLSTVKQKLDNKQYANCDDFAADVELIFKNCYSYNPPDSDVYAMCQKLEEVFVNKWKSKPEDSAMVPIDSDSDDEGK